MNIVTSLYYYVCVSLPWGGGGGGMEGLVRREDGGRRDGGGGGMGGLPQSTVILGSVILSQYTEGNI